MTDNSKNQSLGKTISRRSIVQGLSAGAMVSAAMAIKAPPTLAASTQTARQAFDPASVEQSVSAFLKLAGSLGNETVRRWYTGKIFAYLPGEKVRQLFYFDGFYLTKHWRQEDGTHRSTMNEITLHRDIETGRLLEKWNNPFIGRVVDVRDTVNGPLERLYNRWGWDHPKSPRTEENPFILEWTLVDDTAWLSWDAFHRDKNPLTPAEYPEASSGEFLSLANLTNYYGRLSDIENPRMLNAPGTMFWNGITDWTPWMMMGQRPGTLIFKSVGVKVRSFRDIPDQVFKATEARYPGCLTEKVQWPEGGNVWNDFLKAKAKK